MATVYLRENPGERYARYSDPFEITPEEFWNLPLSQQQNLYTRSLEQDSSDGNWGESYTPWHAGETGWVSEQNPYMANISNMSPEAGIEYLKNLEALQQMRFLYSPEYVDNGDWMGDMTHLGVDQFGNSVNERGRANNAYGDDGVETFERTGYSTQLTPNSDIGAYYGSYDLDGNLVDVDYVKHEENFFDKAFKIAVPLLIGGAAFAGLGGLGGFGGAAGTAAADAGLGFAAGGELAGLAAAEAGFGGSAGLAGLEAALAGGAGAAGAAAMDVSFDPFKDFTNLFDTPTSAGSEASGNFWDSPYMDAFETTPYPGQSFTLPFQSGDTGTTLLGSLGDLLGGGTDGLGSLLGSGKGLGAALGGLAGGLSAANAPDSTTVTQRKVVDPRMDKLIFGDGDQDKGLMGAWSNSLNKQPSQALQNLFGIGGRFFGA